MHAGFFTGKLFLSQIENLGMYVIEAHSKRLADTLKLVLYVTNFI